MKTKLLTKTLLASAACFSTGVAIAAPYEVIDLGGLGGNQSFGWGINNSGETVGYANGPLVEGSSEERVFDIHAFYNDLNQTYDLNTNEETNGFAFKINDAGIIIGYINETIDGFVNGRESAVKFSANNAPEILDVDDGFSGSRALGINSDGDIVGYGRFNFEDADGNTISANRGFRITSSGTSEPLPIFGNEQTSDFDSYAISVNDNDVILGWSERIHEGNVNLIGAVAHVTLVDGTQVEIPNFGGREGYGLDINNNNIVVGRAQDDEGFFKPFVYDSSLDVITEIPYINNDFRDGVANSINQNNQVVGNVLVTPITIRRYGAFLYENNQINMLNNMIKCDSGWDLQQANDINDNGEIVGIGTFENEVRAFKLIPTGEPVDVCEEEESSNEGGGSSDKLLLLMLSLLMIRRFAAKV